MPYPGRRFALPWAEGCQSFGLKPGQQARTVRILASAGGDSVVRFQQYAGGLPVLGGDAQDVDLRIIAKLFSGEYEALEVLKLKDIVTSLEGAIDAFEKVANTVEQIAVKES